jgi:crotonobetainyl-CoA:carnitine CoA-transferase CaiB-like acyl-CoA transferase
LSEVSARLSAPPGAWRSPSAALGQQTDEVLKGVLGLREADVAALRPAIALDKPG